MIPHPEANKASLHELNDKVVHTPFNPPQCQNVSAEYNIATFSGSLLFAAGFHYQRTSMDVFEFIPAM